uniref:Ribosomal protein L20 n=1 Tax=Gracilariopsis mclachlanii TaxID=486813 RepID=A0A345UBK6_9FLOR|nr:ribosomal protein L20 [Gracilariopsis mclachlanii]AXI97842.1 ribosomal protein L20 [Gracilariopsis mclachlanii]
MMKIEIYKTKSRKHKKRRFNRQNISHIKLFSLKYNLFKFFVKAENIKLNKKILSELFTTEIGSVISLMRWNFYYINN